MHLGVRNQVLEVQLTILYTPPNFGCNPIVNKGAANVFPYDAERHHIHRMKFSDHSGPENS